MSAITAGGAITATDARKGFFGVLKKVIEDHAPIEVVTKHGNAVIMSKADYDSLDATAYLLSSPANAARLRESLAQARHGNIEVHELIEV